jgi:hypothetical protein
MQITFQFVDVLAFSFVTDATACGLHCR